MSTNKKICEGCQGLFTSSNISKHKKICDAYLNRPTYESLLAKVKQLERELAKANETNEKLKKNGMVIHGDQHNTSNSNCTTINNVTNVTNNYYVIDAQGLRDGLDMTKLRNFGEEDVSYVDKTQPLPNILKDIYYNKDHMENRVISHEYPCHREWMLFKCQDFLVRLHLETDRSNVPLMEDLVCDNVQKLLGKKFDIHERRDAIVELLAKFDDERKELTEGVDEDEAYNRLPVWNRRQYEKYKELRYDREPAFGFIYPERMYVPPKYD